MKPVTGQQAHPRRVITGTTKAESNEKFLARRTVAGGEPSLVGRGTVLGCPIAGNPVRMRPRMLTPDPLRFDDGSEATPSSWPRRRQELGQAIVPHEYGGLPPEPDGVEPILRCANRIAPERVIGFQTYEIRVSVGSGEICFPVSLWIPPGDGPFPVILDGDGCWRYCNDAVVRTVLERGFIAASFDRTALAADNADRYRDTGLYRLFPDAEFGTLAAWAWGYHRCVDALHAIDGVAGDRIAITGHSRGGKAALLAGATDERIALTNPNCSGTGGSGSNRLKGEGAEVIADFLRSRNIFWFGTGFAEYAGRDAELAYDQHFLHALIAPRGLLVTEAFGDPWANPPGSYAALRTAERVYRMLGAGEAIGWAFRDGVHDHSAADYRALLDFADRSIRGRAVARDFQPELFGDAPA